MCRIFCFAMLVASMLVGLANANESKTNILIVTVDDMSADSLGAFGCKLAETSPNIDQFAKRAMKFNRAHVHVGNCMPGRNIMWSGMFSHANGIEGFRQKKDIDYPVLCDLAKQAGYFTGIRGKVSHSTPYSPYAWDAVLDTDAKGKKYHIKDAASYGASMRAGIRLAAESGKPFCLMMNISDPHKPFYAQGKKGVTIEDRHVPSKVFTPDEVPVPGFLPDDAVIRKELAHYYSSVRRADDCFQQIMTALDDFGGNTFVLFLSDHGMPLPFAKTQLYHHSTHTPLMVLWPGVTKPMTDNKHFVGAIDFIPTLLEVMGSQHPTPDKLHGRSFVSILRGEAQTDREHVILQYNENAGRNRHPMRGIQNANYLYLFNPWSDGKRKFATATTGTMTYAQMVKRAVKETRVAERLQLFDHRVLHELYDVENDPDCLVNLIGSEEHHDVVSDLQSKLHKELTRIGDPAAQLTADFDNEELRLAYMAKEDKSTQQFKKNKNKNPNQDKLQRNAVKLSIPDKVKRGGTCVVSITHRLPVKIGKQKLHVTWKQAKPDDSKVAGKRLHREVVEIAGKGKIEVSFPVPDDKDAASFRVAAFLGEDFQSNIHHQNSDLIVIDE